MARSKQPGAPPRSNGLHRPQAPAVTRHTPFEDLPQFLTVDEFRVFVGIGRSTVYDLLRRDAIPHQRFGKVVRIPKRVLGSYLDLKEDERGTRDA